MHKKLEIKNYFLKLILCAVLFCLSLQSAIAVDINPVYSIRIDEATIEKGYEVKGFEDKFQIAVFPYVLKIPARIELKNRTEIARSEYYRTLAATGNEAGEDVINEDVSNTDAISRVSTTTVDIVATSTHEAANRKPLIGENPDGWEINSDIYEFDVMDKNAFDGKKPFVIIIKYDDENLEEKAEGRKKIFYYDGVKNEWIGLPSTIMYEDKLVRAVIQLPYAKLAIFKNENILSIGKASWYKYKGCNCAASPDYPKGTKLKITAINSDKSVIVEVNDYGPERDKFPDRVIDLDLEAFIKIAKKGAGVIDVKVEPVDELCSYGFQKAKHPEKPAPEISAPIAVLIDEPTGEILYAKNEKEKHSIASITKLMTASVFLDMQHTIAPSADAGRDAINRVSTTVENWNKIIKYSKADDLEGAKLYVNDGETMTVKDIFYSMLVGSANNAAKTLVKNSGIEYSDFIQKMNEKAKKWHLENT
ncbi:MAG: RlpA-like double-psi beta-barrel domain-containing protein, partial [bacterium]